MWVWVAGEGKGRRNETGPIVVPDCVDFLKLAEGRGNRNKPERQQPDFSIPSVMGSRKLPRGTMC